MWSLWWDSTHQRMHRYRIYGDYLHQRTSVMTSVRGPWIRRESTLSFRCRSEGVNRTSRKQLFIFKRSGEMYSIIEKHSDRKSHTVLLENIKRPRSKYSKYWDVCPGSDFRTGVRNLRGIQIVQQMLYLRYRTENHTFENRRLISLGCQVFYRTVFNAEIYAFYTSVTNAGSSEEKEKWCHWTITFPQ